MPRPHDLPVFFTSDMEVEITYAVSRTLTQEKSLDTRSVASVAESTGYSLQDLN